MKTEKIGQRNITIIYEEPFRTTTHLILGDDRVYVCDTFIGPGSMNRVEKILKEEGAEGKPIVVFNSHADWDHIWGNCYYDDAYILAHRTGRERVLAEGETDLERNKDRMDGEVIITPPNLVFETSVTFADDEIEFFHSPGHTIDSSACYDHKDKVLFVGDNVESDIPYVNSLDFDTYIASLNGYLEREWIALIPGHDPVQYDDRLVRSNIDYLKKFRDWSLDIKGLTERALGVHLYTLTKLVDPLIECGINERIGAHYSDALEALKRLDRTETTQKYMDALGRIVNML